LRAHQGPATFLALHWALGLSLILISLTILPATASGQSVIISLDASCAESVSGAHHFGFRDEALTGYGPYDMPEPPLAPAPYLAFSFSIPGSSVPLPNRWRDDIRSSADFIDRVEVWEMHVETDLIGQFCSVAVDCVEGSEQPVELAVIGLDPIEISVPIPGTFSFTIGQPFSVVWLELTSDTPIVDSTTTWGEIKNMYR